MVELDQQVPMECFDVILEVDDTSGTMWTRLPVGSPLVHPLNVNIEIAFAVGLVVTLVAVDVLGLLMDGLHVLF